MGLPICFLLNCHPERSERPAFTSPFTQSHNRPLLRDHRSRTAPIRLHHPYPGRSVASCGVVDLLIVCRPGRVAELFAILGEQLRVFPVGQHCVDTPSTTAIGLESYLLSV